MKKHETREIVKFKIVQYGAPSEQYTVDNHNNVI